MKRSLIFFLILGIVSCRQKKSETIQNHSDLPETSLYWMANQWKDQDGKDMKLKDLSGKAVVLAMMFTSCKASCPRLVADVQSIEQGLDPQVLSRVTFILCSIDPEYDTPKRLKAYAAEHHLRDDHWTLLTADEETVRELSALLGVKYKKTSPIEFSHSNIISVFTPEGDLYFQQEGINSDPQPIVKKINGLLTP